MISNEESAAEERLVLSEHQAGDVTVITINRGTARNALSAAIWDGLEKALAQATGDGSRAAILTGAGGYFSAGGDLKTPPSGGRGAFAPVHRLQLAHHVLLQIARAPIPVIAAVERGAVGLGWGLALSCDMIFASRGAAFSAPFIARGVVPDGGVGWILARRLGRQVASDLLLSGRTLLAEEALGHGLVARVTEPGQTVTAAVNYAASLPAMASATELTKRLVRQADDLDFASYLEQELLSATLCQTAPEAVAAREAFLSNSPKPARNQSGAKSE